MHINISTFLYDLAVEAHKAQTRWDKTPYIRHPIKVAEYAVQIYEANMKRLFLPVLPELKDILRAISYGHDIKEDQPEFNLDEKLKANPYNIPIDQIERVLNGIDTITKTKDDLYHHYIKRVGENPHTRIVKLADLKHNLEVLHKGSMKDKYLLATMYLENLTPVMSASV